MNIISVIGNRPQFIKTVLVSKEIRKTDTEIISDSANNVTLLRVFNNSLTLPGQM